MNIVEFLDTQAVRNPDQTAISHGGKTIAFQQLAETSCRKSAYLQHLGLTFGDVVLVFVPMSIDLYVILMSVWRRGMVAMFLDPSAGRKNLETCISRVPPKAFIGTPVAHLMRMCTRALRKIPIALCTGAIPFIHSWGAADRWDAGHHRAACTAGTPALITFTSGATGIPKGTVRTHGFLRHQKTVLEKTLSLQTGQSDLATLPIFALINIACGVSTIIPPVSLKNPGRVDARPILADLQHRRPQSAVASPAFFDRLLADKNSDRLNCLKKVFTGGAPVFPGLLQRLSQKIPHADITAVYGSTEAEPIAELSLNDIRDDDLLKMAQGEGLLAGFVVEDIDCHILEDNWGEPLPSMTQEAFQRQCVPSGHPGEIVVHGKHVLKGYLAGIGDKENKFTVMENVWHRTGDLGYLDELGRLWLLGRCSAKIADEKGTVYPFAVETAVMQLGAVKRAALCRVNGSRVLAVESTWAIAKIEKQLKPLTDRFHIDRLIRLKKIPVDKRHNAKIDYTALVRTLKGAS